MLAFYDSVSTNAPLAGIPPKLPFERVVDMGVLDHWHPVRNSRDVKTKPVGIQLDGQQICLFRRSDGTVAAIDDVCPHRRLKLSYGTVMGDRIQCKYHGWTFDACGNGESPSTPKMHTCTMSYDAVEKHGFIWIKSRRSNPVFPTFDIDGYGPLCNFLHTIPAPLELAVDNFTEIEHSGTVHDTFGYDIERMHEVKVRFETTDTTVRVINEGPTKRINRVFATALGIGKDYLFHDDWTTFFSPLYCVYDHYWTTKDNSREAMVRWRFYMFFWPVDGMHTNVTTFVYGKSRYPGFTVGGGGLNLMRGVFRRAFDREVRQDVDMLKNLGDYSTGIEGLKLSRFDKVLGLTRERINSIYRGVPALRIAIA